MLRCKPHIKIQVTRNHYQLKLYSVALLPRLRGRESKWPWPKTGER